MSENYCGKSCETCAKKELIQCPGCKAGPGRAISGECPISQCCRSTGHESCATCINRARCGKYSGSGTMPEYFARKRRAEAENKAETDRRAPFLGKWLWLLFWLVVPIEIAGLMTNDTVAEWFPALVLPGEILSLICLVCHGLILWVLRNEHEGYRTAAKLEAAVCAILAVTLFLSANEDLSGLVTLLSLGAGVISLISTYNEYTAHSSVAMLLDSHLSEQWDRLWNWYIITYGIVLGGTVLTFLTAALSLGLIAIILMLAIVAASIAHAVVGILKLVYLYRTAQLFRHYEP